MSKKKEIEKNMKIKIKIGYKQTEIGIISEDREGEIKTGFCSMDLNV